MQSVAGKTIIVSALIYKNTISISIRETGMQCDRFVRSNIRQFVANETSSRFSSHVSAYIIAARRNSVDRFRASYYPYMSGAWRSKPRSDGIIKGGIRKIDCCANRRGHFSRQTSVPRITCPPGSSRFTCSSGQVESRAKSNGPRVECKLTGASLPLSFFISVLSLVARASGIFVRLRTIVEVHGAWNAMVKDYVYHCEIVNSNKLMSRGLLIREPPRKLPVVISYVCQ